jgi:hypothetical protein
MSSFPLRTSLFFLLAATTVVAAPGAGRAQPAEPAPTQPPAPEPPAPQPPPAESPPISEAAVPAPEAASTGKDGKKKKDKKAKNKDDSGAAGLGADASASGTSVPTQLSAGAVDMELRGRVMVAAAFDDDRLEDINRNGTDSSALSLSVPSARASLRVIMLEFVSLVIEAEVAGNVRLRDGYVQAKKKRWAVRAGQFKMPISSFHLESPWTLPVARRGWLHELLSDHMLLTGRREGFTATVEGGGFLDPALTLGAFRSVQWGPDAGDPVEGLAPSDQTVVARLATTPAGVELALVGQRRVTQQAQGRIGYWAGGFDATGSFKFERTGLRFWAETLAGSSWFKADPAKAGDPTFVEGRALVGFRWGGMERGELYVEPFITAGALEPDTAVVDDTFLEIMAGANLGHWRDTRLTLQLEYARAGRNFPRGLFLDFEQPFLASHKAALLQVGAAF